eukprot:scaffold376_cov199-Alexandrium_tamarense.AAC.5
MVTIHTIMSMISATMLIRRCIGGTASAFVGVGQVAQTSSRSQPFQSRAFVSTQNQHDCRPFRPFNLYPMTATTSMHMSTSTAPTTETSLVGIDWVRSSVVSVLNTIFDPVEIAKGAAIAKLDGGKQKKKKKKKQSNDDDEAKEEEEPRMSDEERTTIIEAAASSAKPFTIGDSMVTPATKPEFGDYQCNAAMSLAKSAGLNPRECASKIVDGLKAIEGFDTIMEEPEIAGPGFINLRFKDGYLAGAAGKMAMDAEDGGRLAIPVTK